MLGNLAPQEIEAVLHEQLIGRIGCHADGLTYVVPISYVYDGSSIICHTHEGQKTAMMRRNPHVCFQTDDSRDLANWRSVLVQGSYEELTNPAERDAALEKLLQRYLPVVSSETTHLGAHWPFRPEHNSEIGGLVFRIRITERSGRFESQAVSPAIHG